MSINLFILLFPFKVHLWIRCRVNWFMSVFYPCFPYFDLWSWSSTWMSCCVRHLPARFHLKPLEKSKYWKRESHFPQYWWPTLSLQEGINTKLPHFHWQTLCAFSNTFSTEPAAKPINLKKQLVDDVFRVKKYYYLLNVGIHCVILQ